MGEGKQIDFGKFVVGYYKHFIQYGKCEILDGTVYQLWKFYIWIK